MKTINITILYLLISLQIFSQASTETDANIFGDVQNKGEHIPFITITIEGTTISTTTDATGHYNLVNLPTGKYKIIAQAFGYLHQEKTVILKKGESIELNFSLNEDLIGLEEVVVSSDRNAVDRKSSNIIVNSINTKVFAMTNSVTLVEGLDFTPGLRTESNCQNCGFSQVRMNGLEGPYSQILINSRPIFSGLAGVYGLELFPANMVEKVEVVRGGGSVLYGGNAIAGIVNIITKEPTSNTFSFGTNISVVGIGHKNIDKPTLDRTANLNASILSENKKSGFTVFGMMRDRDPYDKNGDGFSEEVLMKNQTLGLSTFYKPTTRTKLNLDLYNIHEFRRGGNMFEYLPHETDITEQLEHDILGINLSFDLLTKSNNSISLYTSGQTVDRNSYYGALKDKTGYGRTNDISTSSGFQYSGKFNFIEGSKITSGIDHSFNKLIDQKLGIGGAENSNVSNQTVQTIGSFFQYEWKYRIFKLSGGIRYDNYLIKDLDFEHSNISNNVVIPRANLLIDITDNIQLRTGYAKGYRAPQIFDEDLHIETSGARRIIHVNSPDLKQETSDSYTFSLDYDNIFGTNNPFQTEFIVETFYTQLHNPFANKYSDAYDNGNLEYVRVNAESGANVYGVNIETTFAFSKSFITQIGFTKQKSLYEEAQHWGEEKASISKLFMRSPESYGFITIDFSPFENFNTSLTGTYTGKMYVPHIGLRAETLDLLEQQAIQNGDVIVGEKLEISNQFLNLGLKFSYDINLKYFYKIRLNSGVQNILNQTQNDHDRGTYRDAGYIYGPNKSRTIFFGLEFGTGLQ